MISHHGPTAAMQQSGVTGATHFLSELGLARLISDLPRRSLIDEFWVGTAIP